ncbi:monooxygenase family protein [Streptomyces noursei]|uniref:monooxygenase family protein n=1 Tax=Streptomyces noursei TaxID=1971 RepID=UPI001965CCA2|nr:DUF4188 domain-containing protein [Streptomyces noursei]
MSTAPITGRVTAAAEGYVVVFLIGIRINRWRSVRHWLPALLAMPRMLKELAHEQGSGPLGHQGYTAGQRTFTIVQYRESREKLLAYASTPDQQHRPAWAAFNHRRTRGWTGPGASGSSSVWMPTGRQYGGVTQTWCPWRACWHSRRCRCW